MRRRFWFLGALVLLLGTALSQERDRERWIGQFSAQQPGLPPDGWKLHHFPRIGRHTVYGLVQEEDRIVLKAESQASASALMRKVEIDPSRFSFLEWAWKIESPVPGEWGKKRKDDFAARLFVIFEAPEKPLSFFGKLVMKMAGGFQGRALNYVWANGVSTEQIAPSPYTDRVAMIAVESGEAKTRRWVVERRNVVEDFRRAFHAEPGTIVAIALMTDTDNTKSQAVSYYGDIRFLPSATP